MKEQKDNEEKQEPSGPTMSEKMFEVLNAYYEPANSPGEADEMKSTQDLMDEMESIQEVYAYEVNLLMEAGGYKMHYTGSGYAWMMKKRLNRD